MSSVWRTLRCAWLEALILGTGGALLIVEGNLGAWAGGLLAASAGLWASWQTGALQLAWRAPRVDALGVSARGRDLPWTSLELGERILEQFSSGAAASYRTFFPALPAELRTILQGLLDAPREEPRFQARLRRVLSQLETYASPGQDPAQALARLSEIEARASALSSAVGELRAAPAPRVLR